MCSKFLKSRFLIVVLTSFLVLTMGFSHRTTRASSGIDMLLVIALDVSASVDDDEFNLMREGLARAIASPEVTNAISAGLHGAIGVNIVQWSGFIEKEVMIGWSRISGKAQVLALSQKVRAMNRRYDSGATDLGGAIEYSHKIVMNAPFKTTRKVIDIAGDGTNNVNDTPNRERDRAVMAGIIINGLAVTDGRRDLTDYYTKFVIGGDGSFVENAKTYVDFEHAMRRKLIREIGNLMLF